jgi:hypothetical protein
MFASEVRDKSTAVGARDERPADLAITDDDGIAAVSASSGELCSTLHPMRSIRFRLQNICPASLPGLRE